MYTSFFYKSHAAWMCNNICYFASLSEKFAACKGGEAAESQWKGRVCRSSLFKELGIRPHRWQHAGVSIYCKTSIKRGMGAVMPIARLILKVCWNPDSQLAPYCRTGGSQRPRGKCRPQPGPSAWRKTTTSKRGRSLCVKKEACRVKTLFYYCFNRGWGGRGLFCLITSEISGRNIMVKWSWWGSYPISVYGDKRLQSRMKVTDAVKNKRDCRVPVWVDVVTGCWCGFLLFYLLSLEALVFFICRTGVPVRHFQHTLVAPVAGECQPIIFDLAFCVLAVSPASSRMMQKCLFRPNAVSVDAAFLAWLLPVAVGRYLQPFYHIFKAWKEIWLISI